jgi:mannose-1-phosphate guanylyltransferase/mannose-6-phosphate isomerase
MKTPAINVLPVLLAGGSGTRLWPLSREKYPKQFLSLVDERSLLQNTALRAASLPGMLPPLALCGEAHRFVVAEQLREAGIEQAKVMLEPQARGTAPAAACAAFWASKHHGGDTVVLLLPADQIVVDLAAFAQAVEMALLVAQAERLVCFGVKPARAETGFGYLHKGEPLALPNMPGQAWSIAQFIEKPDATRAQAFVGSGEYYWNGGMFAFCADVFLAELARLDPVMAQSCEQAVSLSTDERDFLRLDANTFAQARNDSIDYAVMERTDKAALVPLDAGWDDVGSWRFLQEVNTPDADGNVSTGDVLLEQCRGSSAYADSGLLAMIGLEDVVVVTTSDAVLVANKAHLQDVKTVVERLKLAGRNEAREHPRVYRPWGWYETVAHGQRFLVKHILVKPGGKLSLQMHHHRAEHWTVVRGVARVVCGEQDQLLAEDQSTYIPLGHKHRLENPGKIDLELIEVQSGSYLDEDDIVRFDDQYGRESAG